MDSFRHKSAVLFQHCLLGTVTNIEEMRLEFLEKDETQRIMEVQKLMQATLERG